MSVAFGVRMDVSIGMDTIDCNDGVTIGRAVIRLESRLRESNFDYRHPRLNAQPIKTPKTPKKEAQTPKTDAKPRREYSLAAMDFARRRSVVRHSYCRGQLYRNRAQSSAAYGLTVRQVGTHLAVCHPTTFL